MTLAQKITAIGENLPALYDAGKQWVFHHIAQPADLFYKADFSDESLSTALPNSNGILTDMFRMVTGLRHLSLALPTEGVYKLNYFAYGSSLVTITFPGGVKVSDFTNFASRSEGLQRIDGILDLSQSSSNTGCFGSCPALQEVRFAPESIRLSINFKQSEKLSAVSVASILEGLAPVTEPQTLTLHETVKATLSAEQITALETKNWLLG